MTITSNSFNQKIAVNANLGYKLFVPDHYDPTKSWPIILFLHGINRRGSDLSLLDNYGLLNIAENSKEFNFLVLAPQCPMYAYWPAVRHEVLSLLEQVMTDYSVDNKKVYLTGFSMGGNGAWDLATHRSELFAAVVTLAGWYEKEAAELINLPIWVFHGEEDDKVSFSSSVDMVEGLRAANKEVLFTSYPGASHNIMDETYSNPELYTWLLSKEKTYK